MFHGWMLDPDGDRAAADSTRSSTSLGTGWSVNPRTALRLVTASYTSMIAYLPSVSFPTVSYNTVLTNTIPRGVGRGSLVPPTATCKHLRCDNVASPRVRLASNKMFGSDW